MGTHGIIKLKEDYTFFWMLAEGRVPEVSGHIEKPKGGILKGSSGWYRTDDPQKAVEIANEFLSNTTIETTL